MNIETISERSKENREPATAQKRKPNKIDQTETIGPEEKKQYHFAEYDGKKSGSRCKVCKNTTRMRCTICDVNFCLVKGRNCFMQYHLDLFK